MKWSNWWKCSQSQNYLLRICDQRHFDGVPNRAKLTFYKIDLRIYFPLSFAIGWQAVQSLCAERNKLFKHVKCLRFVVGKQVKDDASVFLPLFWRFFLPIFWRPMRHKKITINHNKSAKISGWGVGMYNKNAKDMHGRRCKNLWMRIKKSKMSLSMAMAKDVGQQNAP